MFLSSDLRDFLLVDGSFRGKMNNGKVKIYSTTPAPADADASIPAGDLLHTVTGNGDGTSGLQLAATPSGLYLPKDSGQVWGGENSSATGTARVFRYAADGEDFEAAASGSPPRYRLQGNIGLIGAGIFDMALQSVSLTVGTPLPAFPFFRFSLLGRNVYFQLSTGLVQHILATGSLRSAINGTGVIKGYAGTPPVDADAQIEGANTHLITYTKDGDGSTPLSFEAAPTNGFVTKLASETWEGTGINGGGAITFFRWELLSDTGGTSSTALRMQGHISDGVLDRPGIITDPQITDGATGTISAAQFGIDLATPS